MHEVHGNGTSWRRTDDCGAVAAAGSIGWGAKTKLPSYRRELGVARREPALANQVTWQLGNPTWPCGQADTNTKVTFASDASSTSFGATNVFRINRLQMKCRGFIPAYQDHGGGWRPGCHPRRNAAYSATFVRSDHHQHLWWRGISATVSAEYASHLITIAYDAHIMWKFMPTRRLGPAEPKPGLWDQRINSVWQIHDACRPNFSGPSLLRIPSILETR
jgi:hypothetical protein